MSVNAKLESASMWFAYADSDIRSANILSGAGQYPAACFHAQQAAEKAFKGLLSITGEAQKMHSIAQMAKFACNEGYVPDKSVMVAGKLDRFYIATRYPDALPGSNADDVFDVKDALDAISVAEQTVIILKDWAVRAGVKLNNPILGAEKQNEELLCQSCGQAPCACPKG
jgi:HEPN domain-containing protein